MTNNEVFLYLLVGIFVKTIITGIIGILFAFGVKGTEDKQNNKLSMLVSVLKHEVFLCCIIGLLSISNNIFTAITTNSFKKEVIKYQQSITPEQLNNFVYMKQFIKKNDTK